MRNRQYQERKKLLQKKNTGWEPVAPWYRDHLREEGSLLRGVVYPNALRLLAPEQGKKYLDVACGEGSFAQLIIKTGASVMGIDASPSLIRVAEKKHVPRAEFIVEDARNITHPLSHFAPWASRDKSLPLLKGGGEKKFDGAVCLLAIQNIDPMEPVFAYVARVLAPGALFVIVMNHPCFRMPRQSGWGWDEQRKLQYRRVDRYLDPLAVPIQAHPGSAPGIVTTTFHRPLSAYIAALASAGLVVAGLEEWVSNRKSDSGPHAKAENLARNEIPMFLAIIAKLAI